MSALYLERVLIKSSDGDIMGHIVQLRETSIDEITYVLPIDCSSVES